MIRGRRSFPITSLFILFLGLAITVVAWNVTKIEIEDKQMLRFETESSEILKLLELRTKIYETSLRNFRSAYMTHINEFDASHFEFFAQSLNIEKTLPSLNGFAFYRYVPENQKSNYQQEIRDYYKNNDFYNKFYQKFEVYPAGSRPLYFVLEQVFPFQRNVVALGKDLYEDEIKRLAVDYAIENDFSLSEPIKIKPTATKKKKTHQEFASGVILMTMPVWNPKSAMNPKRSIQDVYGILACGFQTNLLVKGIINPDLNQKLLIRITDIGHVGEEIPEDFVIDEHFPQHKIIYISDHFNKLKKVSKLYKSHIYEFGGRRWKTEFFATELYTPSSIMIVPSLVFMGGIIFTMLFFGITITKNTLTEHNKLLEDSEDRFKHIVDFVPLAFVMTSVKELRIMICNQRASEILGMRQDVAVGALMNRYFLNNAQKEQVHRQIEDHKMIRDLELKLRRNNGDEFWALLSVTETHYQNDNALLFTINDISQRKALEEQLTILATLDGLTGISNRRHFLELANHELKRSLRVHSPLVAIMLDIDFFKKVNDTYGHDVGDKVIKTMAQTLSHSLREVDYCGRLGGEEFACILPDTDLDGAYIVAERIRKQIEDLNITLDDQRVISFTISSGLAKIHDADHSIEEVLQRADQALYQAKQSGRNKVCQYSEESIKNA